ncbi:MAG: hypothetical protein RLZZ592_946 [Pseudomonadota bacterium]|jgi:hypothetical protein
MNDLSTSLLRRTRVRLAAGLAVLGALMPSQAAQPARPADPSERACPGGLPEGTRCLSGQDLLGAWYWIAVPRDWSGVLVVHAHGGPALGEPSLARVTKDLMRWKVMLQAGHAWAASSYRQGGFEVLAAGEDTERLRRLAVDTLGTPRHTVLHGQSWGASVAARMAERYTTPDFRPGQTTPGARPYDGVLLTNGVLAGATRAYDARVDLRTVYQAVCANHPRPDEPSYPLWMGLPPESTLTRLDIAQRVDECTGVQRPAAARSATQQQRLDTLTRVLRLPESALIDHLQWATWHFRELTMHKLAARNPFTNAGVLYSGSDDDEALNRRVPRLTPDPAARAELARDGDPTGGLLVPTLTLHGIDDPTAFVEMESHFRSTVDEAGAAEMLTQAYTRDSDHEYLSDAAYVSAIDALLAWSAGGPRPQAADLDRRCRALPARWKPASACRFEVDYQPAPLEARVPLRGAQKPVDLPATAAGVRRP